MSAVKAASGTIPTKARQMGMDFDAFEETITSGGDVSPGEVYAESGGATGAKKTAGWDDRFAQQYYEQVRNRKPFSDATSIARHTPFTVEQIEDIRQHVFIREHMLIDGMARFDPDYEQAQAWQRLALGKGIKQSDIVWLNHELLELTIMRELGHNYNEAHAIANASYDWDKALIEGKASDDALRVRPGTKHTTVKE